MYTMSVLCIVLCALCLPFLVFGQDTCPCTIVGNGCIWETKYKHPTKQNRENIALGKPAVSTSTAYAYNKGYGQYLNQQGCMANNGNRSEHLLFYYDDPKTANCIHTGEDDINPKWTVNLLRKYTILEMAIYSRNGYPHRLLQSEVRVDDQVCRRITNVPPLIYFFQCDTNLTGQNIAITKSVRKDYPTLFDNSLNICEFEIWICRLGYYGDDCAMRCEGCKEGCDYYNGTCRTDECNHGFYQLPFCNMRCGHCKNNATCEINGGNCPSGCQDGWKGDKCDVAIVIEIPTTAKTPASTETPAATETPASTETGGSNLGLILGIIVGLLALLAGLFFILARRRKSKEEEALNAEPDVEIPPEEEIQPPVEETPPAVTEEKVEADQTPENEKKEGSRGTGSGSGSGSSKESDVDEGEEQPDEIVSDEI